MHAAAHTDGPGVPRTPLFSDTWCVRGVLTCSQLVDFVESANELLWVGQMRCEMGLQQMAAEAARKQRQKKERKSMSKPNYVVRVTPTVSYSRIATCASA